MFSWHVSAEEERDRRYVAEALNHQRSGKIFFNRSYISSLKSYRYLFNLNPFQLVGT